MDSRWIKQRTLAEFPEGEMTCYVFATLRGRGGHVLAPQLGETAHDGVNSRHGGKKLLFTHPPSPELIITNS
eukprot:3198029-Pleurochrysis_carterae.AAC.1